MTGKKVFKNPTIKNVIFQIQFPNLFYIESNIPQFQIDIMREFPNSELFINQPFIFTNNRNSLQELDKESIAPQKVWQFSNPKGYTLSVTTNSLSISSDIHKTYDGNNGDVKFRDIISRCLDAFKKCSNNLPFVNRIGLRYTDQCPLENKTTENYNCSFNSALSLTKFPVENIEELSIKLIKTIDKCKLIYQEGFNYVNNDPKGIVLDFDAFKINVPYEDCLETTDELHDIITKEFFQIIKEPIIKYMDGE